MLRKTLPVLGQCFFRPPCFPPAAGDGGRSSPLLLRGAPPPPLKDLPPSGSEALSPLVIGALSTPSILQHPTDLGKGPSPAAARCAAHWTRLPHQRTGSHGAGGTYPARRSAALPSGYPALPRRSSLRRRPSPRCAPPRLRCAAINPVPVASSSTVLCRTTNRISFHTSRHMLPGPFA